MQYSNLFTKSLVLGFSVISLAGSPTFVAAQQAGNCDYTDADLYAGWGWDPVASASCAPLSESGGGIVSGGPTICQFASSDPDGDGWGWENDASCKVDAGSGGEEQPGGLCIDTDGDGWGWNGVASCVPGEEPEIPVVEGPACIDEDGDGYGWDGTATCLVDGQPPEPVTPVIGDCAAPDAGTTLVSSTGPVRSTGNSFYYPDNGPQCVVPSNRFNGPGLFFGDFMMINNAWNGDKSTWDWSQCIALQENTDGSVVPSWDYDWGNEDDLPPGYFEWEVKSYPEIIYGIKSPQEISAPCEQTGLPVVYRDIPQIDISFSYRAEQTADRVGDRGDEANNPITVFGGDHNVAIESFLHSSCDIKRGADSNREFELMVWLEHDERLPSGQAPSDTYTDSSGRVFDVYVKGAADPGYIAYVAQNELRSGTLNWNEFLSHAKANSGGYGINTIQDDWCLANILMGTEIWWGKGGFDLDYYQITRSY